MSSTTRPTKRLKLFSRKGAIRLAILLALLSVGGTGCGMFMFHMPGENITGTLPPLTAIEAAFRDELKRDLYYLGETIGNRNIDDYPALLQSAEWIVAEFAAAGYEVERQAYEAFGKTVENLSVELPGTSNPDEIIVIGGHYDSVMGCPGANDNGTGTVATLALARAFAGRNVARTLRFVTFVNEEPPYFWEETMGSLVYAKACRERGDNVVAMLSLETMGYFDDAPGSQQYPRPFNLFYPDTGNFIAVVGNLRSRKLVRDIVKNSRDLQNFPYEGLSTYGGLQGIGWSDHWAFWQVGYPAVMLTDTAPFRYPYYHTPEDTPDKVDYDRFARVVANLVPVINDLAEN